MHDIGPHAGGACHQLDAPEHARDLASRHVVDLVRRVLVPDQRDHQPGDVLHMHEMDEREPLPRHEDRPAELEPAEEDRLARHERVSADRSCASPAATSH